MKKITFLILCLLILRSSDAQHIYFTKAGKISFYSKTSLENIEAHHKSATAVLDTKTGNIQFSVLMKGFEFEKALMQEHFNENYAESDKFPKSEFKGQLQNNSSIDYNKEETYDVKVKGNLTIRNITKNIAADGKITIKEGKIQATSIFYIKLSDYKINIPGIVKDKLSNDLKIEVTCLLEPLKR